MLTSPLRRWLYYRCSQSFIYRSFSTWSRELPKEQNLAQNTLSEVDLRLPTYPWTMVGIDKRVAHALVSAGFSEPTEIQKLAAAPVQKSQATLIAAETGAGKTMAYIAPLISSLRHLELNGAPRLLRRPRALVLAPTRELVAQVRAATVRVSRGMMAVRTHTGGLHRSKQQRELGMSPVDILVVTPSALTKLRRNRSIFLSNIKFAVFDEADVLLRPAGGFDDCVSALLTSLRATADRENRLITHVYAAASVPNSLRCFLTEQHGEYLTVAKTASLHHGPNPSRVSTRFVRVNGGEDAKFTTTVDLVKQRLSDNVNGRIMVFCDSYSRRAKLADTLREKLGEPVVQLSGGKEMEMEERDEAWNAFRDRSGTIDEKIEDEARIAVCAQSFGRGIDHTGVTTVIMVDVPMTGTEYMHRAGRIRGRGIIFVLVNRRERSMAAALYLAAVRSSRLAGLTVQQAREMYPGGLPSPLIGDDASAVARAKRSGGIKWIDSKPDFSRMRRRRTR